MGAWLRWPEPWLLVIVPALVLHHAVRRRTRSRLAGVASVVLLAGVLAGFATHYQLHGIRTAWPSIWEAREERAAATLGEELDGLVESGETAAEELSELVSESFPSNGSIDSLEDEVLPAIRQLRDRHDLEAMAVYGSDGRLRVWDGVHRGSVPEEVTLGAVPFAYGERPLFSYLYFTRPIPSTGGTAVGASLLSMALPPGLEDGGGDFVSRVEERTGEDLTISRSERMAGESVWDFRFEDDVLFSVTVVEPRQSAEREATLLRWGRMVLALLLVGWGVLAVSSRGRSREVPAAAVTLLVLAVLLPLGRLFGASEIGMPSSFLLASPLDATLLRTLAVTGAAVVALGMTSGWWRRSGRIEGEESKESSNSMEWPKSVEGTGSADAPDRRAAAASAGASGSGRAPGSEGKGRRWLRLVGAAAVAGGFPLTVWLFRTAPSPSFLVDSDTSFILVQAGAALALSLLVFGVLAPGADLGGPGSGTFSARRFGLRGGGGVAAVLAAAGALGLSVVAVVLVVQRGSLPLPVAALWVLPAGAVLWAGRGGMARVGLVSRGLLAGLLGVTCAVPFAWEARVQARMELGETELARLDTPADPYTEFLLQRFSSRVDSLEQAGAGAVELLYGAWVESGLAEEGIPAWLTLWSPGDLPLEDLRIGVPPPRPTAADEFLAEARVGSGPVIRRLRRPEVRYVAVVPLESGNAVTAVVPPRSAAAARSSLEPLFGAGGGGERDPLELIPLLPGDVPAAPDSTVWMRTEAGWRGERTLELPDGTHHAHYLVELAGPLLLTARGTLLLALDLGILGLLFGSGLVLTSRRIVPVRKLSAAFRTFQGRVTVALFGFFVLSVSFLGLVGYRALAGAAERTATALADRVVDEAAGWYLEVQGAVDLLARRVGSDLLEYQGGQLVGGSASEMVELGLYPAWVPYSLHERLSDREALTGQSLQTVGSWEYVVAYRRMPDEAVLGAPVPVAAGAAALRRQEMIDLLGFSLLVGAALSLGLAYLVGRTLARPIRELRTVTGQVGRGDLQVQLPGERLDEFGAVFEDFNRMVGRLRRARRDLVRTTRRTQAIIDEAATGVVALDSHGHVTLVNPRAEELLGADVDVGAALPRRTEVARELAEWVEASPKDGLDAGNTEIHVGERRIRVQARRISGRERMGGLVLSLEDVTDELRTERILAWGEMAQQVAHEVKNPLTPIKLGVQHIRRAWEDQRPDFAEILEKNVDATLAEIDRLASIARSFSRFAAPGAAGEAPLVPVVLTAVVEETLNLYSMDEGRIRFEADVPDGLPLVRSRAGEIKEVLVNLLENARTAIEDEGTVRVEARLADGGEDGVELRVRDDGPGIPEHLLPRIFEPHFSTRSAGTGLGLAIVRRLAESWGGSVGAESRIGEGTVITVLVPLWDHGESGPGEPGGLSTV
ncbi:MAG: ATP-binding protein [Gemmatimonadota bacterium]